MRLYYMIKCISGNNSSDTKNNDIQNTSGQDEVDKFINSVFCFFWGHMNYQVFDSVAVTFYLYILTYLQHDGLPIHIGSSCLCNNFCVKHIHIKLSWDLYENSFVSQILIMTLIQGDINFVVIHVSLELTQYFHEMPTPTNQMINKIIIMLKYHRVRDPLIRTQIEKSFRSTT